MDPRSTWKMHLYGATVDTGSGTPYDTVLLTTIAGYTGYTTKSVYIIQSGQNWNIETFSFTDVSGSVFGKSRRRKQFNVVCFPFTFKQSTIQDLEDIDDLSNLIDDSNYLWVRFEAGERSQPSTTTAYPVIIDSWSHDIGSGVHRINLTLRHRYRS